MLQFEQNDACKTAGVRLRFLSLSLSLSFLVCACVDERVCVWCVKKRGMEYRHVCALVSSLRWADLVV